jgi:hypothetical protein
VERFKIPYRDKDEVRYVRLGDGSTTTYGKGVIRLEIEPTNITTHGVTEKRSIDIMELGQDEMLLGYDWLHKHNPVIDWQSKMIRGQTPACKVAGVRIRDKSPTTKSSTLDGTVGKISTHKIRRIYEKDPQQIGVIWVRKAAVWKTEPSTTLPKEYDTDEFRELFEETEATDLADHQDWDHEIHLEDGAKLKPGQMYPVSQDQEEEVRKFLKKNLAKGFIRESKSPMASPILFVKKSNGGLRLCVDFRAVNAATRKNRYPLPLIQELMDRLQGAKWFSKFDVREGFYRIRIAKGHEWITAFKTRYGLYEWMVMPFGLTNAPATFQSVINKALHEYLDIFVTAYLDDILVYSKGSLEEHVEHVKKVLRKLKEYRMYLQPAKCEFHIKETTFLGFIISTEGVKMDPKKIAAVKEWTTPKTVKDVQSFLGFANYYRKFIKNYSKITTPLTEITKKEKGFQWDNSCQEAFDRIKQIFLEAPVLAMYDPRKPTRVETDASDYALGAILSQEGEDGKWRPVYYHSRKFSGAELNYDVHDKELLGIISAFEAWETQLIGLPHPIQVFTDHQNLTSFMTTKKLNRRQVRWAEFMANFDFKIFHRAGTLNGAADALSRRSDLREKENKILHDAVFRKEADGSICYNTPRLARIAKVTQYVEDLTTQWQNKVSEWAENSDNEYNDETIRTHAEHIPMLQAPRTRPYVPPKMRKDLIKELHESKEFGHASTEEMVRRLQRAFTIPRLRASVQEVLSNCLACLQNKPKRHKPYGLLQPLQPPTKPWTSVTMDFIVKLPKSLEPGSARLCDTILVIVDRLTKATKFVPTEESITAEECAYEVTKALVSEHGVPEEFITDRDKLFTSAYWSTFLAKMGVKKKLSTSFHPETDGQTERTNQTLEQYLRMYANKLQDNWVELLPTAQLAYNSTRSATTKYSPHYANYGYEPTAHRDPKDIESISVGADDKAKLMQELHDELSKNIAQRNLTTSKSANKQRIEGPTFKKGDKVFLSRQNLKTKRPCRKLDNLRIGPFEILEVKGPVNYKLRLPEGMRIHPVFHVKLLEPAPPDAEIATNIELEDDEYEVEEIKDLQKIGRQWKYLVKWYGWPDSQNTWEPKENLTNCMSLVHSYHRRNPEKQNPDSRVKRSDRKKDQKGRNQPVTSPDQPRSRSARVRRVIPYPEPFLPPLVPRPDPGSSGLHDHGQRNHAHELRPLRAPDEAEQLPPQRAQAPDVSAAFLVEQNPTLPRKQINCTQLLLRYNQHNGQSPYPRNNASPSLRNAYNGKSFHDLVPLHGQHEPGALRWNSENGRDEIVGPWAWLGRQLGRGGYNAPPETLIPQATRLGSKKQ